MTRLVLRLVLSTISAVLATLNDVFINYALAPIQRRVCVGRASLSLRGWTAKSRWLVLSRESICSLLERKTITCICALRSPRAFLLSSRVSNFALPCTPGPPVSRLLDYSCFRRSCSLYDVSNVSNLARETFKRFYSVSAIYE